MVGRLHLRKDNGLARDVFDNQHMISLPGNMGIARVRYPTAGCSSSAEAQPFYVNSPFGICLAHNGNLTNAADLKRDLFATIVGTSIPIPTPRSCSTCSLMNWAKTTTCRSTRTTSSVPCPGAPTLPRRLRGVAMIPGFGVIAFRDPNGIRPLVFGVRDGQGPEMMVASESVALDTLDFDRARCRSGRGDPVHRGRQTAHAAVRRELAAQPCIFEFVFRQTRLDHR